MNENSKAIFKQIQCPICETRLANPVLLKCDHVVCRRCLEIVLRNNRDNYPCKICSTEIRGLCLDDFRILPEKHIVRRLLNTFSNVEKCQTCCSFTEVESCAECSEKQCETCQEKHENTHKKFDKKNETLFDNILREKRSIIEPVRSALNETEFQTFLEVLQQFHFQPKHKKSQNQQISKFSPSFFLEKNIDKIQRILQLDIQPRDYQIELATSGVSGKNSLICLPTGAGKTLIAGLIVKSLYLIALQAEPVKKFKCAFLVPIRALVDQQYNAFKAVFPHNAENIMKRVEKENGIRFRAIFPEFSVFFVTFQRFLNFIKEKSVNLTDFDLIVIDECHHCYDNHPLNDLMSIYHHLKPGEDKTPQIIGLTASVGTKKGDGFSHLIHLCANLDCTEVCAIIDEKAESLLRLQTNSPLADQIVTIPKPENDSLVTFVEKNVLEPVANKIGVDVSLKDLEKLYSDLIAENKRACETNDQQMAIGTDFLRNFVRFLTYYRDLPLKQCFDHLKENLQKNIPTTPTEIEDFCQRILKRFYEFLEKTPFLLTETHDKLKKLVQLILSQHRTESRGLVLVRTKFHTIALETFFNQEKSLIAAGVKSIHLTGQGSNEEMALPSAQQIAVLEAFRSGEKNLLVATDVAQEGLDIPSCSFVIRYEFVSNEIGTVQSRGRARANQSRCFIVTENDSINHNRELDNRLKETDMKHALVKWRNLPSREFEILVFEEQKRYFKSLGVVPKSSITRNTSTTASPSNVEVLCRYCSLKLTDSNGLRFQGTTVVCVDQYFDNTVRPPRHVNDKIICPAEDCHREIGAVILISRDRPGFVLYITALKFLFPYEEKAELFKKWSQYPGTIKQLY